MLMLMTVVLWAAAATSETITTKHSDCVSLRHHPSDDVAVKPGVDAGGWAVEPADLNPPALEGNFDSVAIGLYPSVGERVGNVGGADNSNSGIDLGRIIVDQDGQSSLNGQLLSGDDTLSDPECQ